MPFVHKGIPQPPSNPDPQTGPDCQGGGRPAKQPSDREKWMPRLPSLSHMLLAAPVGIFALQVLAEPTPVRFPATLDGLVHFTTVRRGEVTEHMLTSPEAIAAAQAGQEMPDGTQVILADYRDGALYRYFVMEKGAGWGTQYAGANATDDWQWQWYWPDGTINADENTERCRACHAGRESQNYMFTYRDLMAYRP